MRLSVFLLPFFFLLSSRLFRSFFIFLLKCTGRQKKGEKKREKGIRQSYHKKNGKSWKRT